MKVYYFIDDEYASTIDDHSIERVKKAIQVGLEYLHEDKDVAINISFVDDERIKKLNKEYRNVDKVTDVLSFPLFESFPGLPSQLGDIVINEAQLLRQAKAYDHSYQRELVYLTIHSLLHLYGYDHISTEDKLEMRALEESIYKRYITNEEQTIEEEKR